jgi:DNA repair photolyase
MRLISNPPNPFELQERERLEEAAPVKVELYEDDTKDILSRNDSPDLPFRWSVNPYRGCFHACAYCYARPSHEYWGFGAGTDFESKIVLKRDAPALLRASFLKPSWKGELIVFSGNTDCYQPVEAAYKLTRGCLEVCAEFRNPVGIITKSALIARDLDVLSRLQETAWVRAHLSIPFLDADVARKVEPNVPSPAKRFETLRLLSEAGIPTAISIAPVIPGLNDGDIPELLMRAREAGAVDAAFVLLRLSGSVREVFLQRMAEAFPDRIDKITNRIRNVRGGKLSEGEFFKRYEGQGEHWRVIEQLFEVSRRKAGFPDGGEDHVPNTFSRPSAQTSFEF